ncbi:keratin, type I cytoskeletal 18 isoform X1 [Salmo trutta]|uniref:Keratin, type I cytoskeletal 18-like n=1 Tax=Salmo trutta TaxID=8032 RepID=A0A673VUH9_SALTR|nr:keratin, type I cytoskeletal 18-like isoform X1 [Salmo trutta]
MSKNRALSMFGGAGGRGSKVSVASLEGLRNAMRSDPENSKEVSPAPGPAPDDKKTMKGLNDRLSGYLGRVRNLEEANKDLEDQIQDILGKRGDPNGRDWDVVEKPLNDLRKKLRDMTMDNACLLLQIDNTKLANDDFKNKLDNEKQARKTVERDLIGLKKMIDDNNLNRMQLESQIESVKEELAFLKRDHKADVDELRKKIKDSNVLVEFDSQDNNLSDTLNKIRSQYEKLAKKNLKDTDDWYQSKFDSIKVEVVQNTEALHSGKNELKDLRRQRHLLEIDIQSITSMVYSHEESLKDTDGRYNREMTRLNKILVQLEGELVQVRTQVERHVDDYQELLHVKMKLEAEIENYRSLMHDIAPDDSVDFSLEQAVNCEPPQPPKKALMKDEVDGKEVPKKTEAPATQKSLPPIQEAPTKKTEAPATQESLPTKAEAPTKAAKAETPTTEAVTS